MEKDTKTQLEKLKLRLPYTELDFDSNSRYEQVLTQLLEDSESIALSNLYPFIDWSEKTLPKRLYNWQLRACVEICNFLGKEGLRYYSENGLDFSKLTDGLSYDLQNEIMPMAGYIKPKTTEGNNDIR